MDDKRYRACELRREGWALRWIARELGVALSSVSVWVRDVSRPRETAPPTQSSRGLRPGSVEVRAIALVHEVGQLRRCGKCERWTPLSNFGRHPKGRQWWCKDCFRTYFAKRGQQHRDQSKRALLQRRVAAREFVNQSVLSGCLDCGVMDPRVLEFDHVGSKSTCVSQMTQAGVAVRRIQREVDECEVVCVNCHRRRTYRRAGTSWRVDPGRLETNPSLAPGERRNLIFIRDLLMNSACCDCGTDELAVLEFDHREKKVGNVTRMARDGSSLLKLKLEIAKCEIRCANCHRRRTIAELRAARC